MQMYGQPAAGQYNPYISTQPIGVPSNTWTAIDVIMSFRTLDTDKDGQISNIEFVQGLKSNWDLAQKFGLSESIYQEQTTRDKYDLVFGQIDYNNSKTINVRYS